jgi:hypothetical protein
MSVQHLERRAQPNSLGYQERTPSDIVRLGLAVQQRTGTVSAIELLKSNKIDSAIIQRVLSGSALRADDRLYLETVSQPKDSTELY